MGAGNSKSAADAPPAATANADASSNGNRSSAAAAVRDEAIGMVIDGIVLYGMYVTATYLYKVREQNKPSDRIHQVQSVVHDRLSVCM